MKPRKLEQIDKKLPFEAPEGYFDDFSMQMQNRIAREESIYQKPFWKSTGIWKLALAPALLLALAFFAYIFQPNESAEELLAQANISHHEILSEIPAEHLADYLAEETDWHRAELYEIHQSNSTSSSDALEEELIESMDLQELEDYL